MVHLQHNFSVKYKPSVSSGCRLPFRHPLISVGPLAPQSRFNLFGEFAAQFAPTALPTRSV
jgi:hypothetical protein